MKKINLLFSMLVVLFTINANAQIVYTDINPDGMPSGGGFDFNGDNTNEFSLSTSDYITYTWSSGGTNIWANGTSGSGWDVPKPLTQGTTIDANGNFIGAGDVSMNAWGQGSPFPLNQDSYMGVRLSLNGQIHFGWIRVMWDGTNFIYKDFAYESTANTAINAGSSTSRINNFDVGMFRIYPNPAKNAFTIDNKTNISKVKIVDLSGKEVKESTVSNANNQTIDISDLNEGVYLINLYENNKIVGYKRLIVLH